MKLRTKMLAYILLPTLLFFAGTVYYVSIKVHDISEKNAMELLYANGQNLAQQIQQELETPLMALKSISQTYEALIVRGETPSRDQAVVSLREMLDNNPNLVSTWMFWTENAFDGRDEEYKNTNGHDATGLFIPIWTKNSMGQLVFGPIKGYDEPGDVKNNIDYVLQTGKSLLYEPYIDNAVAEGELLTSIAIPIRIHDKVVGVAGVDIKLEDLSEIISEYTFYETGFAGLVSNSGTVISHLDEMLIGTNYFDSSSLASHEAKERVMESVKQGNEDIMNGYSDTLQTDIYRLFTPVYIGDIETPWSAFLTAPFDEVMKDANQLASIILTITIIAVILIAIVIIFVTYRIVNVIKAGVVYANEIANGNFSQIPPEKHLKRKDEMGELARAIKLINENMSKLIGKVQDSTKEVHHVAVAINDSAKQSADAANDVAHAIAEVSSVAENQKQSAEENAKSIDEMSQGIQRNAQAISVLSEASNEMNEQANLGKEVVQLAIEQMNLIQNETLETKGAINELQQQAYEIEGIVAMITDISEQTNLLALNAAIEAARAGEAGKGFAVVADEVRNLADQTNVSAQDIQKLIASIQEHSNKANQSMNENEKEVTVGIERIQEVEKVFTKIIDSVSYVVKEIDELAAVMEQMAAISEEVTASSQEIASSAENTSGHAQQVAASAEEQLATMEELASTTSKLKNLADDLNDLIKQFKVLEM